MPFLCKVLSAIKFLCLINLFHFVKIEAIHLVEYEFIVGLWSPSVLNLRLNYTLK